MWFLLLFVFSNYSCEFRFDHLRYCFIDENSSRSQVLRVAFFRKFHTPPPVMLHNAGLYKLVLSQYPVSRYISRYVGDDAIRIAILVYRVNQCTYICKKR